MRLRRGYRTCAPLGPQVVSVRFRDSLPSVAGLFRHEFQGLDEVFFPAYDGIWQACQRSASYGSPFPHRPKGMWKRTYEHLRTEYKRAQMKTLWLWRGNAISRRLAGWSRWLDDADDLALL
jgi:hypothetical protein